MAKLNIKDIVWPYVTYIMANHNYEKYIENAINSVLKQDYNHDKLTLCIIDDASTDGSWELIHNKLFKDIPHSNVKYDDGSVVKDGVREDGIRLVAIRNGSNLGISRTRNVGMTYTSGQTDYYAILDSDDENFPEKTKRFVLEILQNTKQIGVIYGDFYIWDVKNNIKTREFREPFDRNRLYQDCIVTNSGCLINKAALEQVDEPTGWYDETLKVCEDYDLWLRISEKWMILHVAEPLTVVRINHKDDDMGNTVRTEEYNACRQQVYQKTKKRMQHART